MVIGVPLAGLLAAEAVALSGVSLNNYVCVTICVISTTLVPFAQGGVHSRVTSRVSSSYLGLRSPAYGGNDICSWNSRGRRDD